uniref:(northern house mosquito) hypothetical protein n=1 Tax=Culex pipiens TaxID=7175 RepID=A0A8D8ISY2_CULPI
MKWFDMCATLLLKKHGYYPSTETKHQIAVDLIDRFPQLAQTEKAGAPPESDFFYINGGKGPGNPHTGKVFKYFKNEVYHLGINMKKFPRVAKTLHVIDDDIVKANEKCGKRVPNAENFEIIRDTMITTQLLFENYLIQKRPITEMFSAFPHLKSYDGLIIQELFERLTKDKYNKYNSFRKLLANGNISSSNMFEDVEDGTLRGCLNIMNTLDFRGIKRKHNAEQNLAQTLARPLIRWINNTEDSLQSALCEYNAMFTLNKKYPDAHVICKSDPLKKGEYFIYLQNEIIPVKKPADVVLDVFFKIFKVTGAIVPTALRKLHDFVHIAAYKVLERSDKEKVNILVESFNKAAEAEQTDSD